MPDAQPAATLLRLETGDRLTPGEFDRRYLLRPDLKAELIDGVVYVASPVNLPTMAMRTA